MDDPCKAKVTSVDETSITILVLNGTWEGNVYRMPVLPDVKVSQFVDIIVRDEGAQADWVIND